MEPLDESAAAAQMAGGGGAHGPPPPPPSGPGGSMAASPTQRPPRGGRHGAGTDMWYQHLLNQLQVGGEGFRRGGGMGRFVSSNIMRRSERELWEQTGRDGWVGVGGEDRVSATRHCQAWLGGIAWTQAPIVPCGVFSSMSLTKAPPSPYAHSPTSTDHECNPHPPPLTCRVTRIGWLVA